jgi:hypothetical protein
MFCFGDDNRKIMKLDAIYFEQSKKRTFFSENVKIIQNEADRTKNFPKAIAHVFNISVSQSECQGNFSSLYFNH